jgi:parallel beta-helix repeat protein
MTLPWAATYHFAADGDDTRTASQAGNPATPWKSLSKVASLTLKPNDSLLLRKGDVWRESLVIRQSGGKYQPIVISSYGVGTALPELRGTIAVQGTSDGSFWSTIVPKGLAVKTVFRDNLPIPISRYPDTGWIFASAVIGATGLSATELATRDWTGASIHLRTAMWTLETNEIATQSGGQVTFARNAIYNPPAKVGFFLTNHPLAQSPSTPSWSFAKASGTLRWNGSASAVEAAVLPTLLNLDGSHHIRVQGLRFFGATLHAIKADGNGIEVFDCQILYPGMFGVRITSGREGDVSGNRIVGSGNDAIYLNGPAHKAQRNTILRTAATPFLTPDGMGDGCCGGYGILAQGDSAIVARNVIDSTGYNGAGFMGRSSLVEENEISHSCMVTDDCAGLYTITGFSGSAFKTGAMGSVVRRNIVRDVVGSLAGWADAVAASQGIYLDDGSHDIRVDSNVVSGATNGLYLHNTQRVQVKDNLFYGNRISPVLMTHDGLAGTSDMKDNLLTGNLMTGLVGQGAWSDASLLQAQDLPLATFQGNTSCLDHLLHVECRLDNRLLWERFRYDTAKAPFGPETPGSAHFDITVWGWGAYPWQTEFTRDSGKACAKGGCMRVATAKVTESNAMVYGGVVPVQKGTLYRLRFSAKGSRPGQRLTPTLRHARNSWAAMGYASGLMLDTAWNRYELYMRADVTEDTARIDFTSQSRDSLYWLDEVSFRSVPDSMVQGLESSRLVVNPTPISTSSPIPGSSAWMDPWGNALNSSLSLAPWQAKVIFPSQGSVVIGIATKATKSLLATRNGRAWTLSGLTSPTSIIDAQGRLLARLEPDSQGRAVWTAPAGQRMCFLHTAGRSQALVTP